MYLLAIVNRWSSRKGINGYPLKSKSMNFLIKRHKRSDRNSPKHLAVVRVRREVSLCNEEDGAYGFRPAEVQGRATPPPSLPSAALVSLVIPSWLYSFIRSSVSVILKDEDDAVIRSKLSPLQLVYTDADEHDLISTCCRGTKDQSCEIFNPYVFINARSFLKGTNNFSTEYSLRGINFYT